MTLGRPCVREERDVQPTDVTFFLLYHEMPEALDSNPYRVCFWIQVHSVSFFNHAEKSDDATYI